MLTGIRQFLKKLTNTVYTSSVVLTTVGLTVPIAANQKMKLKFWVPLTTGATGGLRTQLVVPVNGISFLASIFIVNTVAVTELAIVQNASAVFTDALANAGTHYLQIEADIVNGATAGNIDLQFAQDTSDAASLTILAGANVEVLIY